MVASFVYPVTMSLVPFAAAALARNDPREADRTISSAFRLHGPAGSAGGHRSQRAGHAH